MYVYINTYIYIHKYIYFPASLINWIYIYTKTEQMLPKESKCP